MTILMCCKQSKKFWSIFAANSKVYFDSCQWLTRNENKLLKHTILKFKWRCGNSSWFIRPFFSSISWSRSSYSLWSGIYSNADASVRRCTGARGCWKSDTFAGSSLHSLTSDICFRREKISEWNWNIYLTMQLIIKNNTTVKTV